MEQKKISRSWRPRVSAQLIVIVVLLVLCSPLLYPLVNLWYGETKGPFRNWMQVVDLETDGDLDVIVSHTRWEEVDISWAGIGLWVNQGDGTFELVRDRGTDTWPLPGFAAGAGDIDQDQDLDMFIHEFQLRLLVNQGGLQGGEAGQYLSRGGIDPPSAYEDGHPDMGGTITMGDLNGDGRIDAFVAGCCYGVNASEPGYDFLHIPSVSWIWINDSEKNVLTGHIFPMASLNGLPIRQAALGDLDGDGDLDVFAAVGMPTMGTVDSLHDQVLLNDGTGQLEAFSQQLDNEDSTSVALGDVNGDGYLDALVGMSGRARLWINQSNELEGTGQIFVPSEQSFEAGQSAVNKLQAAFSAAVDERLGLDFRYGSIRINAVFLNDLDGDRDLDALIARLWGAEIWWNDGQGEYERSDLRFSYRQDTGVAVADFDGDGDQDIFIGRNEDNYQVWFNDGKGGFKADNRK